MKINQSTALSTSKLVLVPYSAHHVPTYHTWMQSPTLQELTASEPLTLDEEYAMQRSWRQDADKLTFIICHPLSSPPKPNEAIRGGTEEMIGDINLFLSPSDDDDDEDQNVEGQIGRGEEAAVGELELMIAVPSLQRKGFGRAALLAFISYILSHWGDIAAEYVASATKLLYLRVRINETNAQSIALFESVGFVKTTEKANYFGELELRWRPRLEVLRGAKGWEEVVEWVYEEPVEE